MRSRYFQSTSGARRLRYETTEIRYSTPPLSTPRFLLHLPAQSPWWIQGLAFFVCKRASTHGLQAQRTTLHTALSNTEVSSTTDKDTISQPSNADHPTSQPPRPLTNQKHGRYSRPLKKHQRQLHRVEQCSTFLLYLCFASLRAAMLASQTLARCNPCPNKKKNRRPMPIQLRYSQSRTATQVSV